MGFRHLAHPVGFEPTTLGLEGGLSGKPGAAEGLIVAHSENDVGPRPPLRRDARPSLEPFARLAADRALGV
jgi:hypothetical protein